ncbi:metalloprotease 1 [Pochonia chlamydosporia 170]|uniref:Metalloprotease 1 n=1 Tax=Pochonia chlamydosporia 170 TaxID=1380566 RepID=A0A179F6L9_METCM|nr:metalloprotease 1 [Pochonia chlamydosporia 170]OAQ61106.1 metalloprotease 1 [Pochonia chlamydosporia 170]
MTLLFLASSGHRGNHIIKLILGRPILVDNKPFSPPSMQGSDGNNILNTNQSVEDVDCQNYKCASVCCSNVDEFILTSNLVSLASLNRKIFQTIYTSNMMIYTALVLAGLAATAMGATLGDRPMPFGCGTGRPSQEFVDASKEMQTSEAGLTFRGEVARAEIIVDTYVHVVAKDETENGGYLSAETIEKQIKVLNDNYAPSGISFVHKNSSWTIDTNWTYDGDETAMKESLRQGTYKDLNLYFLNKLSGPPGVLGYCHFPTDAAPGSEDFIIDGCSLHVGTVPGGSIPEFNLGKTATHEVGHWFGLLHTFDGRDCAGPGDYVDDTPAQNSPTSGCPVGRDSCPNQPGLDPIHNYMDYSSDACYEEFTAGQTNRMKSSWTKYRANN